MNEYLAAINVGEMVGRWSFCPLCGDELIEVYPGDFVGHTNCCNDDCDGIGFDIIVKKDGIYNGTHPKSPRVARIDENADD